MRLLKDEDRSKVDAAARALGKIGKGARAALPALREVVELRGRAVTDVQGAIDRIGG